MEGYVFSTTAIKKAKSYGMSATEYLVYSDLRAAGWTQRDAWSVAFQGKGMTWSKSELEREMNKLEALNSVQKRITELHGAKSDEELTPEELAKATSKEEIMKNLVIAQRRQKLGSPEWQKTTAMIADYSKIKQDELQTEDTTVHFYLPVNYPQGREDCVLFKNGLCKGGK